MDKKEFEYKVRSNIAKYCECDVPLEAKIRDLGLSETDLSFVAILLDKLFDVIGDFDTRDVVTVNDVVEIYWKKYEKQREEKEES